MIPTAWLSSGNFSSRHPCDDIRDLYARADLWGMDEGIIQNDCWHHAGKALMALKRRGAVIFLAFQSMWGSDEAGNHDPLAGSYSASIFIFFHPKAQHICYNIII